MSIASWRNRKELLWSGYYPGRDDAALALKQQQKEANFSQGEQQFLVYFYILVLKNTAEQAHYAEKITT